MTKNTAILLLILTLLLVAGVFSGFMYLSKIRELSPVVVSEEGITADTVAHETKTHTEESKEFFYNISLQYPEFSEIKNTAAQTKINEDVKSAAFKAAEDFKKEIICSAESKTTAPPCELIVEFKHFEIVSQKILSLGALYYYYTQGAHGSSVYVFSNYNLVDGSTVGWKSVFKDDSPYINAISEYSKKELVKKLTTGEDSLSDEGWITDGTKPTEENYNTNVGFTPDGLIILFQQYQVAAYAAGPQELAIPYAELKSFIDPDGLLGELAK
ncbi:MAG: DUF3298 and DUF4163 domain-containing protein [bacterium]|nr:DUF3298 and DUF4163 domain-containing protein [bacterium]